MATYVYFESSAYDGCIAIPADIAAEIIKRWEECVYVEKKWSGSKQLAIAEKVSSQHIRPIIITTEDIKDMEIQQGLLEKNSGTD